MSLEVINKAREQITEESLKIGGSLKSIARRQSGFSFKLNHLLS